MTRLAIATILAVSVLFLQGCPGDEDPTDTISTNDTISLTDIPNTQHDVVQADQITDSTLDIVTPAEHPCKQCQTDADCTGGLVCRDDDNTALTVMVCTRPYVVADGCPPGMYGDYNVSKFCVCKTCSSEINPLCEPKACAVGTGAAAQLGNCKPGDNNGPCTCKN